MRIRSASAEDRNRIHQILVRTGRFTDEEIRCAIDLVDQSFAHPERGEFFVYVLDEENEGEGDPIAGYVLLGPTPMTDGVFDLYWIAVDPARQHLGHGQKLLRFVEDEVKRRGGRMLLIETSSKESYAPTLRFYRRSGYAEISRIKDFYRLEDDKIIFSKTLR